MRVRSSARHCFAGHFSDRDDSFHGCGVRQLRHAGDDIADGIEMRLVRLQVARVHESALELCPGFFQAQILRSSGGGPRPSARVRRRWSAPFPLLSLKATEAPLPSFFTDSTLASVKIVNAAFAEGFLEFRGNLFIFERHDARQHLEKRHFRAKRTEDRSEFHAHRAAPTTTSDFGNRAASECRGCSGSLCRRISTPGSERASEPVANMNVRGFDFGDLAVVFDGHAPRPGPAAPARAASPLYFCGKETRCPWHAC